MISERKALESRTSTEEDRVPVLEAQLAQAKLIAEEADKKYEEVGYMRKVLENCSLSDEERMDALESQLKETRFLAEEADRKYDEVARNLAVVQDDLEHAETGQS
ncbi:Tropomyosin [Amphibalanus amphitrite]|uniref:Tropomyosin n=1 Tax=Amphibalanus amphitrite TaxID=1232801 RepID=A0A6A4VHP0_AMPAM|nr:Tropomyosin [Amphibalanus amphitrite]